MVARFIPRRSVVAAVLAVPPAFAAPVAARAEAAPGPAILLVRRWAEEVLSAHGTALDGIAHTDLVLELHGSGADPDGRPRVISGLPAVQAWVEQVKGRYASPISVRIDRLVAESDTVAAWGENVYTFKESGGTSRRRRHAVAAFHTVQDGKIVRIVRFTDRVGRAVA